MKLYKFEHNQPVKASCCNQLTSITYWMADSRAEAEEDIISDTPDEREAHGNCPDCLAHLLAQENYEIKKGENP